VGQVGQKAKQPLHAHLPHFTRQVRGGCNLHLRRLRILFLISHNVNSYIM
jgi:hypothetical protein